MNVRSYTFPVARRSAQMFKEVNPNGLVLTGGMHATVAPDEMLEAAEFDRICQGPGENVIVDLVRDPQAFPRMVQGVGSKSMVEWPMIDRTLWPKPASRKLARSSLAAGTGMRLGPGACRDDSHQPRVPVAVRLLQRDVLYRQHGAAPG